MALEEWMSKEHSRSDEVKRVMWILTWFIFYDFSRKIKMLGVCLLWNKRSDFDFQNNKYHENELISRGEKSAVWFHHMGQNLFI